MVQIFGFEITRPNKKPEKEENPKQSFVVPTADDGTQTVAAGGHYGTYLDMEGNAPTNEAELIRRYREVAQHPECDMAIEDIINEGIVANENKQPVTLNTDKIPYGIDIKKKVAAEFDEVLRLMDFSKKGHEIFRRWYVDGRIYFHKVIDPEHPRKGITELRYIDPRKIKKIREIRRARDPNARGLEIVTKTQEYFMYNERGIGPIGANIQGIKIAPDAITFCPSGLIDQTKNIVLSYLHKAIKPVNQLRMMEDATVVYRIARAPERRIFYIDVGNLPKIKAEQYLRDVMARYRNKLVYDASTGEIRDDRQYMSMLEDFWLPRREGGRGTEITTLQGAQNLGEITDIEYFRRKLYQSLNVPISRLESSQGFNLGRSTEITRDELKFTKFVQRLRKKFTELFSDILRTQLLLKGIISLEDWYLIKERISFDLLQDGHFAELKDAELMRERLGLANEVRDYIGKFYSIEYVRKHILKQSEVDIAEIDKQIAKEVKTGIIADPNADVNVQMVDPDIATDTEEDELNIKKENK